MSRTASHKHIRLGVRGRRLRRRAPTVVLARWGLPRISTCITGYSVLSRSWGYALIVGGMLSSRPPKGMCPIRVRHGGADWTARSEVKLHVAVGRLM